MSPCAARAGKGGGEPYPGAGVEATPTISAVTRSLAARSSGWTTFTHLKDLLKKLPEAFGSKSAQSKTESGNQREKRSHD